MSSSARHVEPESPASIGDERAAGARRAGEADASVVPLQPGAIGSWGGRFHADGLRPEPGTGTSHVTAGLSPAVLLRVQRHAGNRATTSLLAPQSRDDATVQRAPSGRSRRSRTSAPAVADRPAEMLEAIAHTLSTRNLDIGLAQDVGPGGEQISAPGYYTDIKKSIHEPGDIALLWEWYRIALANEPDGRGGRAPVEGSAARRRIARADAQTRPLLAAAGTGDGARWATAYAKGLADLTARSAREEVTAAIDVGMAHEHLRPGRLASTPHGEEEETESLLRQAIDLNLELIESSHKMSEHYGETIDHAAGQAKQLFDQRMEDYLTRLFKQDDIFAEAPEPRAFQQSSSSFVTGMAFVKGGLDAALAIMSIADPKKRAELFASHSHFFGNVGGAAQISKVMLQFASASVAYYGYATYSIAKVAGNTKLAEEMLDLTVHRVGGIASHLYLVGAIHGVAVLLDPEATSEQKGEAAVETVTNVVAIAGTAGRSVPMLEGVAGWSGPVSAALAINWVLLKKAASLYQTGKEGIAGLGGGEYRDDAFAAAIEVQEQMAQLAVAHALLAVESDEPRRKELEKAAGGARWGLMDQSLKPYLVKLFGADGKEDDEGRVGLRARLRPVIPLVDQGRWSDEAALEAGAAFQETVKGAFEEWGKVVLTKEDPTTPEQFVGRRGVVIRQIPIMHGLGSGVVHIRNDADLAAGAPKSVAPDEPFLKARTAGSGDWSNDLLPGQVVRVTLVEKGELWVSLDSLRTPVLPVSEAEKTMANVLF